MVCLLSKQKLRHVGLFAQLRPRSRQWQNFNGHRMPGVGGQRPEVLGVFGFHGTLTGEFVVPLVLITVVISIRKSEIFNNDE